MTETPAAQEEKAYSRRINRDTLSDVNKGIRNFIVLGKRYRDPAYSARKLADDIHTNTRYLSAAIRMYYGCNFSELVNKLRVDEAKEMLANPLCTMTIEDISISSGFANRQSFYSAFERYTGVKPKEYRKNMALKDNDNAFELLSFD